MSEFLADFRYGFTHPGEEFRFRARRIARAVRAMTWLEWQAVQTAALGLVIVLASVGALAAPKPKPKPYTVRPATSEEELVWKLRQQADLARVESARDQ